MRREGTMQWIGMSVCVLALLVGGCADETPDTGGQVLGEGGFSALPPTGGGGGGTSTTGGGSETGIPTETGTETTTGEEVSGEPTETGEVTGEETEVETGEESEETGASSGDFCDDNVPCTLQTVLQPNGSCSGGLFICGDCAGSGCEVDEDCAPFNDDNACNGTLKCASGHCVVDTESVVSCVDLVAVTPNHRVRCNPISGGCAEEVLPDGTACDDGKPCTQHDVMTGGECVGIEICSPCKEKAEGEACDDGNACTADTTCVDQRCVGSQVCCLADSDCALEEDGNACNGSLACVDGACVVDPSTVVHCQRACPEDTCYVGECIEGKGTCVGSLDSECGE